MAFVKGLVEGVSVRVHPKFGAGHGLKIGNDWYNISFKSDRSAELKGKVVTFEWEANDKGYKNIQKDTFVVASAAETPEVPRSAPVASKPAFDQRGIKVGHAINVGALLVAHGKADNVKDAAISVLHLSRELEAEYDSILAQVPDKEVEKAVAPKPPVKKAAAKAAPAVEEFEDDIPF